MLDYTAPSTILGKPTNADLALGLATAPVLFAWHDYPELGPMIKRKFENPGDVERVPR
jgi:hexaprenyl-diphosphate synthase